MIVLGIDPGASGAIVRMVDGTVDAVCKLKGIPRTEHWSRVAPLADGAALILIEEVTLGHRLCDSYVGLRTGAQATGIETRTIRPVAWQRAVGAGPSGTSTFRDGRAYRVRKRLLRDRCVALLGEDYRDAADAALIAWVATQHLEKTT